MILVTGAFGKIGKVLVTKFQQKKIKHIKIKRSNTYQKKNRNLLHADLLNENHIKKIFQSFKIKHLVHLAVTRNPLSIKKIRNYNTLQNDTKMMLNILKYSSKLKSICFLSSIAIYDLSDSNNDIVDRNKVIKNIYNFLNNSKKRKTQIKIISNKNLYKLNINPLFHKNENKRLNGSNKFINELLINNFCLEKKISLLILRPFRIKETIEEKKLLQKKLRILKKRLNH